MKRLFTLLTTVAVLGTGSTNGQVQPKGFHLEKPINMAAILKPKPSIITNFSSVSEARSIINDIMAVSNKQQNFTVQSTTQVDNAAAVIYQNTQYILYNPSFINQLDNAANDKWASISVLAHEIGHHLYGHILDGRGSQIPKELEADEYSGLVLKRMGATLQQSQLAMQLISSPNASATHPGQRDRLAAISKGWNSTTTGTVQPGKEVAVEVPTDNGRTNFPSTNRRRNNPQTQSREPVRTNADRRGNANNQILVYNINFTGVSQQQYYITAANNVVKINGNRLQVVAKITESNNPRFPYVMYDDQVQMFVDRRGNIYASNGRRIGQLTLHQ